MQQMSELLIPVDVEPLEEGGYLATSPELTGLIAQGRTVAETMEIAQDVARKLIEVALQHGDPLTPRIQQALRQKKQRVTKAKLQLPVSVEKR